MGEVIGEIGARTMRIRRRTTMGGSERGASLIEYTFLLVLVAVVAIGSLKYFGVILTGSLGHSTNTIGNAVYDHS